MTVLKLVDDTRYGKSVNGRARVNATVSSSTAPTRDRTPSNVPFAADVESGATSRSIERTTAADVNADPSVKKTPGRRTNVHVKPSGATAHSTASAGSMVPSGPVYTRCSV